MIKLDNFCIKNNKEVKFSYSLLINDDNIGELVFKDNNINLSFFKKSNRKYESIFSKMFINDRFKKNESFVFYKGKKISKDDFYFMNKYDTLLFDIDDTILDFQKAERSALSQALKHHGIKPTDRKLNKYHAINIKYWHMVEKKLITRDDCLIMRFDEFLPLYGINVTSYDFEETYRYYLNKQSFVMKNAKVVLTALTKMKYRIYAITNGVRSTQIYRINKSKMNIFFLKSFISDVIGYHKPAIEYLESVKHNIENFNSERTLIIGDSLSSDIKLGINGNIDTCWFNFAFAKNKSNVKPTYEINSLKELLF